MHPHNWIKIKNDDISYWHQFECFVCKKQIFCKYFLDATPEDKYVRVIRQGIGPQETRINLKCESIIKNRDENV